jgi:hypothetical protein
MDASSKDKFIKNLDQDIVKNLNKNYELFGRNCDESFLRLASMEPAVVCANTGAFLIGEKTLSLDFFNRTVLIDADLKKIEYFSSYNGKIIKEEEADIFSAAIILHFLVNAEKKPLTGEWILYRELPDGLFYASTIPGVLAPLVEKYQNSGKDLIKKISSYGGRPYDSFKNSAAIYPFKRFPLLFILEEKDEEFEANLRVLFDKSASSYIKSDIIKTLIVYTVKKLLD